MAQPEGVHLSVPSQQTFEIRRAQTDADFLSLCNLLAAYEADLPAELRHGSVPDAAALQAAYRDPNVAFLAARAGAAFGCVAVAELRPDTAVLMRLFVEPAYRSAGAARGLCNAAIAFSKERGYDRIVLDTNKDSLRAAYRLYRSLGFTECDPFGDVEYPFPTFMGLDLS